MALARQWQQRLGLCDWWVAVSDRPPSDDDSRGEADIDRNLHRAVLTLDPTLPDDQVERTVVHELVHVRLAELDDVWRQVSTDGSVARTWWDRTEERVVEALTTALVGTPRREYRGTWAGLLGVDEG